MTKGHSRFWFYRWFCLLYAKASEDRLNLCNAKNESQHGRRKAPHTSQPQYKPPQFQGDDVWRKRGQKCGNTYRRLSNGKKPKKMQKYSYQCRQLTADGEIWREIKIKAWKARNSSCQLLRASAAERSAQELDRNCITAMFRNNQTCLLDRWCTVTCWGEMNPWAMGRTQKVLGVKEQALTICEKLEENRTCYTAQTNQ